MKILIAHPPNFDAIVAKLPAATKRGVVFTYGDTIYNPSGVPVFPALRSHEAVHSQRQQDVGVEAWWGRYLEEPRFRIEEELLAHRAEYRAFKGWSKDRNAVARELETIARRLSGSLYGGLMSYAQARRFIVVDIDPSAVRARQEALA